MRTALTTTAVAVALLAAGCSSTATTNGDAAKPDSATSPAAPAKTTVTAEQALATLAKSITTAKQTGIVTADNDPNSLLGRPGQYTSKVTFSDSRIKAADVDGLKDGDVERGGAIEVFATAEDAKRRADYIETIVKGMPMLMEYDYLHGTVLVRVSKYLTPDQASAYDKAAAVVTS